MAKLVFQDGERVKVLRGKEINEDEFFVIFESNNKIFRINKKNIISVEGAEK